MAVDEKISQLPEALTLDGEDVVPIVQVSTGLNKKVKVSTLLQDAGFIKDIVVLTTSDTVLEIGKINWVTLISDHTMSVPTADASNLGKILIVNNRSIYELTITGVVVTPLVVTGVNSIVGLVCVTNGVSYGWEVFSRYNIGDFDLISQTITNSVTTKAPSEDAVFDALALKEPVITKNALSTPLVWTSANGVASFQPLPVLGDLTYYFTNTASDVATYYKQTTTPQVALTSLPFASVTDGQLLATFISEPSNPNRTSIPDGQYLNHLHLGKTGGTKSLQVRAEIWETTSAGVDVIKLADLGPSSILVGSGSTEYIIGYNTVEKTLSAVTSRIATKIYAVVGVSGSAPSVSIFQGDGSDSRSNLPAPVVDATNYVPYEGMLKDLTTGTKDIIYSNATASTPTFFDSAKKFISATAQLWGTWVQTWGSKATPVDADTIGFHDSASTFVGVKSTLLNLWTAYLLPKIQALNYGETAIEIWSTNANYTTVNTTAKRLVVLQTGTLTATRTLTLSNVTSAGQEVVIVAGGSVTSTIKITVACGNKINVTLNSFDIVTQYSQTLLTSIATNSWTTGQASPQFVETSTTLTASKTILAPNFNTYQQGGVLGTVAGNTQFNRGYISVYGDLNSTANVTYYTPYNARTGWMQYRPTTIKWWGNTSDISTGNYPVNYNPSTGFQTFTDQDMIGWYCSFSLELDTGFKCIFYVGASGVPSIKKIIQDNSTQYVSIVSGKLQVNAGYCNATMFFLGYGDITLVNSPLKNQSYGTDLISNYWAGSLGVGHTSQNASAILQADSTTKGFLPPRMTNAQRTSIAGPAIGLMVYCTDTTEGLYIYKSTGWTFII